MAEIKNIVFDVGDVLIGYRWKDMLMDYGLPEETAVRVGTEVFEDPEHLWSRFDRGYLTAAGLVAAYSKKYPQDAQAIDWFIRHGEYMHIGRPRVWKLVHRLKQAGYRIYLLSNYSQELFHKHTQYADFWADVDGLVVSYMVNMLKPEPEIYKALCDKYHLKKEECLFFDDRQANVKAAREFGMSALQVICEEGLLADLEKLLSDSQCTNMIEK